MALIEDKISEIRDPELRETILREVKKLKSENKFGLVFEEHIPELAPIHSAPIRQGAVVARSIGNLHDTFSVRRIDGDRATVVKDADGTEETLLSADLVVVKRFGEPIYPALIPMDKLERGGDAPYHAIIEADNYHALQLLEYTYAGQVDVIYIDPPYNSGARDWKYNNDYVDDNDSWKHSKWLAFLKRRLVIARRLLREDGVLIITVDENEVFHLGCLLEQLFPSHIRQMITIVINPKGTGKKNFARVEEHAMYCMPNVEAASVSGAEAVAASIDDVVEAKEAEEVFDPDNIDTTLWELRHARRRGRESSYRHQRPNQFYPIYIDEKNRKVVEVAEAISLTEDPYFQEKHGLRPIWPIDREGNHRCWRFVPTSMQPLIETGRVVLGSYNKKFDSWTLNIWERKPLELKPKTVWWDALHDAGTHGTTLLHNILAQRDVFPFPKSVYAVRDCLSTVVRKRPNALVLDFFAGSGTTLHAVALLNRADGGSRRCILVTNNEVSEDEAQNLTAQGYHPGDAEWQAYGICRTVTFPRCQYIINGHREDGTPLEGEYFTGRTVIREKPRTFRRLGFVDPPPLMIAARKKEIVSLIDGIPMSHINPDTAFFVSEDERHTASILFYDDQADAYLEALAGMDHVTHFYIVTQSDKLFQVLKTRINELLGPIQVQEEEKRPLHEGLAANLEYFKLDFLDPDEVALGEQFASILPILWLRAGAQGKRPECDGNVPYLIPDDCAFAVLLEESRFKEFQAAIAGRDDLTHVFLITDSETAFFEMEAELDTPHIIMLYKDYLENFKINVQRV